MGTRIFDSSSSNEHPVKKPGGTFHSMNLSRPILKAVERKGYKLATPIQRKCIPPIMSGRDVVAMARTGSGKSAAFLLPLLDKLKIRQPKSAIRALILSPTREIALQTYRFTREFSKYTNLISCLIVGGESIAKDFEAITSSPDILVATPGRLAHVLVEMKFKLMDLEIVVLDEADRLFEPGFKEMEQVNEICQRLPEAKQTLLFSATMPQRLADFAKIGLKNPVFIRLDVETNLSDTLKIIYLHCNQHDKFAILVYLLRNLISKGQAIVVFMPTKHHIEYVKSLLDRAHINCCYVYSSLDAEARKINIEKFTKKTCNVMLVTDIAARGIDIPLLDIVINFNFPYKPKLFVHRVGRVARAGRFGSAISLVSHDETPYLHSLHMFLGLPLDIANNSSQQVADIKDLPDKVLGSIPQEILDEENEVLRRWHDHDEELKSMTKVCENAMKPYYKSREPSAHFSVKAAKDIHKKSIAAHPIFSSFNQSIVPIAEKDLDELDQQHDLIDRIKAYKPQATIFEIGHIKGIRRSEAFDVMQKKRQNHDKVSRKKSDVPMGDNDDDDDLEETNDNNLRLNLMEKKGYEDSKFYLKYQPNDFAKEKGLEIPKNCTFNDELKRATMDLVADDCDQMKRQKHQMVWDRKRKKFINASQLQQSDDKKSKKIKTESGTYISASYQSGLFEKWKSQSKFEQRDSDDEDANLTRGQSSTGKSRHFKSNNHKKPSLESLHAKLKPTKRRRELKNTEEILKQRGKQEKIEAIIRRKAQHKANRFTQAGKSTKRGSTKSSRRRGRASSNT